MSEDFWVNLNENCFGAALSYSQSPLDLCHEKKRHLDAFGQLNKYK